MSGLYAKADRGELQDFTGITSTYEAPQKPELVLETGKEALEKSVSKLLALVQKTIQVS